MRLHSTVAYLTLLTPSILQFVLAQNTNATNLPVGSCTSTIPCANGACCNGKTGFCGFGSSFCGPDVCTSNCNAKAECGPDAPPANVTCPLNVCCSQFGFCGTTTEFCGEGCKSNCGAPSSPSCGVDQQSAVTRRIGYYEGWAVTRSCMAYTPEKISAQTLTHVNFAFALISSSYLIIEMSPGDADLWKRTTALKSSNPTLKVFLSIGGWSFNDPPTSNIFSDLVGSQANINTFIASTLSVMETYGFDGIDVDWEYPAAYDRGGVPADKDNYVAFMAAVKSAFSGPGYGLTFTAPSSYWYLQHFDMPNLLKYADWVNVMTYDLHGTWDGTDPYIGPIVEAHTNLTEIDLAFELMWRVGVNPSQVVMGMGFYGRSFTLASPECAGPGCPWVSGANAGPCSANSGTLMYSEIMSILSQQGSSVISVFDEVAAVKYITWDTNQWVSYDDAESFAIKMNYANEHCLGGTMIWSVDQDDDNYSALEALYPNIAAAAGGVTQGDTCTVTGCGALFCPSGYNQVGGASTSPLAPGVRCDRLICCPAGDTPQSCAWRGGDTAPCNPSCEPGEELITTQSCGVGGSEAFCCTTNLRAADECVFFECTSNPSCPQGSFPTLMTTAIRGDYDSRQITGCTADNSQDLRQQCPATCPAGQVKPYCCSSNLPYKNCKWVGSPPLCQDNACAAGQVQLAADAQGDGSRPCSGTALRAYCCDPEGDAFVPVPFYDVFPASVPQGAETFQVEFDPDEGSSQGSEGAGTSSSMPADEKEDDEAFGEVFIDSPNAQSVSSLDAQSDWVITGCHPSSDQPQTVLMYCSSSGSSGCAHVMIGGAEHTIVKMPSNCGRGPYARIASLAVHDDQGSLPNYHASKKPASEPVYSLSFDYDFAAIPESNGPIYMRADVTDLPGYWDNVVDSPPERKRWMKERGLEERWWGTFKNWLNKLNTVEKDTSVSRNFHWEDTWVIFSQEVYCPGPPVFDANLDISLTGQANLNTRYGFYLQATIVPPAVQAAYLYFSADASVSATFVVDGKASVTYDSSVVTFASFGFPGLYYPGLLTIGPSLVLNGYITGELSMQGHFSTTVGYNFPSVNFNLGKTDPDSIGPGVSPSGGTPPGIDLGASYGVQLSGDLSIHVVPNVQLGISVLGGAVIDAQAFVRADVYGGVRINGSVSNAQAPQVCVGAYYGVELDAGLTGSLLFWESGPQVWNFYKAENEPFGQCFGSVSEPTINTRGTDSESVRFSAGSAIPDILPASERPSAFVQEKTPKSERQVLPRDSSEHPNLKKRGSVPPCPGFLNCPAVDDQISRTGDLSDNDPYSDLNENPLEDAFYRRDVTMIDDIDERTIDRVFNDSKYDPNILVSVSACSSISFSPLAYNNLGNGYFDLEFPTDDQEFSPVYEMRNGPAPNARSSSYGREHIYEVQLISIFMTFLATRPALWQTVNPNYCTWLRQNIINAPAGNTVLSQLLTCLPHNGGARGMPWLESITNGVKASAINGRTIRSQSTFNRYTYTKKLTVLRATAAVLSYLNNLDVENEFIDQSDCMKDVWNTWYTGYIAANPGNTVPGGINTVYSNWIQGVMGGVSGRIEDAVSDMLTYWDTQAGGPQNAEQVDIDFAANLAAGVAGANALVTSQDLQNEIQFFVTQNGITWVNQL